MKRPDAHLTRTLLRNVTSPPGSIDIEALPAEPYECSSVTVRADVTSEHDVTRVLQAAMRGATLHLRIGLDEESVARFEDALARVATIRAEPFSSLNEEQRSILALLADGVSLGAAAGRLHISRRTADRRLREARIALGARSTAEAVSLFRSR